MGNQVSNTHSSMLLLGYWDFSGVAKIITICSLPFWFNQQGNKYVGKTDVRFNRKIRKIFLFAQYFAVYVLFTHC